MIVKGLQYRNLIKAQKYKSQIQRSLQFYIKIVQNLIDIHFTLSFYLN